MAEYDKWSRDNEWSSIFKALRDKAEKEGISTTDLIDKHYAKDDKNIRKLGDKKLKKLGF